MNIKTKPQLSALLNRLIDYAGLFPPANLALNDAMTQYNEILTSENEWMAGPFIIPNSRLFEVEKYSSLFSKDRKLQLSSVCTSLKYQSGYQLGCLEEDLKSIQRFNERNKDWAHVNIIEISFGKEVVTKEEITHLYELITSTPLSVYLELPLLKMTNWEEALSYMAKEIWMMNEQWHVNVGMKLRTGGIHKDLIPKVDIVSKSILTCRDYHIPLKFTAGLHHPVRMYRDEVKDKMHGYLNVFIGGMLAHTNGLNQSQLNEILLDENPDHFLGSADSLSWMDLSIYPQQVYNIRKELICSFGSCSFGEPTDELRELLFSQEVQR